MASEFRVRRLQEFAVQGKVDMYNLSGLMPGEWATEAPPNLKKRTLWMQGPRGLKYPLPQTLRPDLLQGFGCMWHLQNRG